jgi:hypothetical protein
MTAMRQRNRAFPVSLPHDGEKRYFTTITTVTVFDPVLIVVK